MVLSAGVPQHSEATPLGSDMGKGPESPKHLTCVRGCGNWESGQIQPPVTGGWKILELLPGLRLTRLACLRGQEGAEGASKVVPGPGPGPMTGLADSSVLAFQELGAVRASLVWDWVL